MATTTMTTDAAVVSVAVAEAEMTDAPAAVASNLPHLTKFLADFATEVATAPTVPQLDTLLNFIRKRHYWPHLQVKSFFSDRSLVLLTNSYKRADVKHFQALYDEFRSVVLHLPNGAAATMLAISEGIPAQKTIAEYVPAPGDSCKKTFEGTQIFLYNANGNWHFSTSGCPTVNSSRFSHPTKSHGQMLDEALAAAQLTRDTFTAPLDPKTSYTFLLVHHENCKLIDHTAELGPEFKLLFHIDQRSIGAPLTQVDMTQVPGCQYVTPIRADEMLAYMATAQPQHTHGFLIKTASGTIKLQHDAVAEADAHSPGHHNQWQNLVTVYKQNDPKFKVTDYITKNGLTDPAFHMTDAHTGAPTYVIHTTICTMRDLLFNLYAATTSYDQPTKRYTVCKEIDGPLPPIMRFHLAQLRFIQITSHNYAPLTDRAVYRYLCGLTMKNFRLLLAFLITCPVMSQTPVKAANCMVYLSKMME